MKSIKSRRPPMEFGERRQFETLPLSVLSM
jgi:hypothetical protein